MRILCPAIVTVLLLTAPSTAQDTASRVATIAVTGEGEVELKPDFARIFVAASTQADTVAQAVEANRTATERMLSRIQALGVKREDVETANFQVLQTPPRQAPD